MTEKKKVLIIGGHGKVALLAAPKLVEAGHEVTSLIRNPDQAAAIKAIGATPLVRDLTGFGVDDWAQLQSQFDVVVWSAGNGGKGSDEVTYAVDRDGALASIHGLEKLAAEGRTVPRYVMVSYLGSTVNDAGPEAPLHTYFQAKKAVDTYLLDTALEHVILAPALLTLEPSRGGELIDNRPETAGERTTSRELVADVIVEMTGRAKLPDQKILAFVDGETPVTRF